MQGTLTLDRPSDELVRASRAGDGAAFAELLRPEYRAAYGLARALLHNPADAEDAVQEAAFKAWRKLGNLRAGAPLRPWFLAIVANQCRSQRRRKAWLAESQEPLPDQAADAPDLAAALDLKRAVARLPHDQRLILHLRFSLDLPFEDIALTLGVTPKAARTRVERAVQRLRPMLPAKEAIG